MGIVLIDGPRILSVGTPPQVPLPPDTEVIDAQGGIVCPGLVDIHVHGGDGADATDGTPQAVRTMAARHLRNGSTSLIPTTASAPLEEIWQAFDAIAEVKRSPTESTSEPHARVMGIHMEGPFFSLAQRGAHAPELLRMPTPEERERLLGYAGDLACVTLAPEREGALALTAALVEHGVLVAGGHSDALYGQVGEAMQFGLSHIVHLWSGMSTVRRIGPKRHAGMLEAGLVESGLTGEIIADGYHLPTSLIRMAHRMKGPEKLCLVSDAMRASGKGPGEYQVAGQRAVVEPGSGVAITQDRTAFAGSISTMLQCLQHVVQVVGIGLGDALQMATLTPARIHGLEGQIGCLARGRFADLLVLDRDHLTPRLIMLGGEIVHPDPELR